MQKTVNALAQAFEDGYWTMADTSFKEELVITFIEENKLSKENSLILLKMCKMRVRVNPFVFLWLNGDIEQVMGMYIDKTKVGKKKLSKLRGYQH